MNLYNVKFGRVKERGYVVAATTADKAVDIGLKAMQAYEPEYHWGREDLISVVRAIEDIEIEDTPLA